MKYGSVCSGIEAATVAWHPNMRDLSGPRKGMLKIIRPVKRDADGHIMWLCECDCGNTAVIASNSLTRRSATKSCGCMNATVARTKVKPDGAWNEGKSYTVQNGKRCYRTRHAWAKAAIKTYGNKCQSCGWDKARCDVHHKIPKADGGLHTIDNAMVLCPNCHRVLHE